MEVSQTVYIKIHRLIVSKNCQDQLSGFCDSSEKGYGAVIYLRLRRNSQSSVHVIWAKSNIVPTGKLTS